jgi:hypothetical protein
LEGTVVVVDAVDEDVCGTVDVVLDVDVDVGAVVDVEVDDVDVEAVVDVVDVDDVGGTVVVVVDVELVVEDVGAVVDVEVEVDVDEVDVDAVVDVEDEELDDDEELDEDDELDDDELVEEPPATTGIVASVSVGIAQVTAAWIDPFRVAVVVSWKAFNVMLPEAGATTPTVIVGVVNVPGANGPGVPIVNLSLPATIVPSAAVSVMVTGVCGGAVGTIVAVPGFTIDPLVNVAPFI